MKNLLLITMACFTLIYSPIQAQEYFTVMAASGLNLRATPGVKGKKLGVLPYGTLVETVDDETSALQETIEGKPGAWLKITSKGKTGFLFSGFLAQGELIVPSTRINKDYRILEPGFHCSAANYDPALNWYALVRNSGKLRLQKAQIIIKTPEEFSQKDREEILDCTECYRLKVESDITDSVFFYLGSSKQIPEGGLFSEFQGEHWNYSGGARFLYPEQEASTYLPPYQYLFRAFEGITLNPKNPVGYDRKYQLTFSMQHNREIKSFDLSEALGLSRDSHTHSQYQTPQLIWWGDINQDGLLDFIWYSHTMTDSCGVCWEYHLFMSDKNNLERPIQKVADHIECNCIT